MRVRTAQVSIEYLLITAFAFMFIIPIIILFHTQSLSLNEEVSDAQAARIASEIVEAANQVYYLGSPSKKTFSVYMPKNVENVTFNGNAVIITVDASFGDYEIVKWSAANLTGSVRNYPGIHNLEVEARSQDVLITD